MGYRVDNIPSYAARTTERLKTIVCASKGWTRQYFDDNFGPDGDQAVAEAYNAANAKYGIAIAMEEMQKSS